MVVIKILTTFTVVFKWGSIMYRLLVILAVLIFNVFTAVGYGNLPRGVVDALKSGKSEEMEEILQPSLEVSINGDNSMYSKKQAIQVISEFFLDNKPITMTEEHQGGKGASKFSVLLFETEDQQYRATVRYSSDEKKSRIEQITIEDDLGL